MQIEGELSVCLRNAPRRGLARIRRTSGFFMSAVVNCSSTLPARTLLALLAGKLTPAEIELMKTGNLMPSDKHNSPNPFELALNGGQMISDVSLEPAEGKDDDWVTFKFGEPDPAISPFVV